MTVRCRSCDLCPTMLCSGMYELSISCCNLFLQSGAGWTTLHQACSNAHLEVARVVLAMGLDPGTTDSVSAVTLTFTMRYINHSCVLHINCHVYSSYVVLCGTVRH